MKAAREKEKEVVIQVDGSYVNNAAEGTPVMAGYAFVVLEKDGRKEMGHCAKKMMPKHYPATETRCEMLAILSALHWIKKNPHVIAHIESDSESTVNGILGKAKRKQNRDLWQPMERLFEELGHRVSDISFVRRDVNTVADAYAREVAHALFVGAGHREEVVV